MSSRGFLIYAHNNEEIDYGKIALCASLMIKKQLRENAVCLATDQGTYDWLVDSMGKELVDYAFEHVKILAWDQYQVDAKKRKFLDTSSTARELTWYNGSRSNAYELSPFDETILLDCDVLVQDRTFDAVWGNDEDVLINKDALTLSHTLPSMHERMLDLTTIPMYWATMLYFRKSERAKLLFDLVEHIKSDYAYYQYVYEFPGKLYRNDYVFSIAIHMLSGFLQNDEFKSFPQSKILSSFDTDELIGVKLNELTFLVQDKIDTWKFRVSNVKGVSVHTMNKYSILRQSDKIIELYGPSK